MNEYFLKNYVKKEPNRKELQVQTTEQNSKEKIILVQNETMLSVVMCALRKEDVVTALGFLGSGTRNPSFL